MPQSGLAPLHKAVDRLRLAAVAAAYASIGLLLALIVFKVPGLNSMEPAVVVATGSHAVLDCQECHTASPDAAQPISAGLIADQEQLCSGCHGGAIDASHPSGFRPERQLSAAFPLDRDGRFTCSTCHALHGDNPRLMRAASVGEDLCTSCHDASFFDSMPDKGESLLKSAHFDVWSRSSASLDPYSQRCLICHDDRMPSSRQVAVLGFSDSPVSPAPRGMDHPVGAEYDKAARSGDYRPRSALADEVLLPNGRVGCVSCHVPYSHDHARKPRTEKGLCFECHIL